MTGAEKAKQILSAVEGFCVWPEDDCPSAREAVRTSRDCAGLLYEMSREADFPPQHVMCVLFCANQKDQRVPVRFLASEDQESVPDQERAERITTLELDPIGIVYGILAAESGAMLTRIHGFRNDERTRRILSEVQSQLAMTLRRGKRVSRAN